MTPFILALLRALSTPNGSSGELLTTRRKSHLLQAEWYTHLAEAGEQERKAEAQAGGARPTKTDETILRNT
jgi:hypothetical protein